MGLTLWLGIALVGAGESEDAKLLGWVLIAVYVVSFLAIVFN